MAQLCYGAIEFCSDPAPSSWTRLPGRLLLQFPVRAGEGPDKISTQRGTPPTPNLESTATLSESAPGPCGAAPGCRRRGEPSRGAVPWSPEPGLPLGSRRVLVRARRPISARRAGLCPSRRAQGPEPSGRRGQLGLCCNMVRGRISRLSVRDVRFPTSLEGHGSDAMVSAERLPGASCCGRPGPRRRGESGGSRGFPTLEPLLLPRRRPGRGRGVKVTRNYPQLLGFPPAPAFVDVLRFLLLHL